MQCGFVHLYTLYKFHTYRIYCIYMSHYLCLFVNSLRMSEDNKALLTYLLTYLQSSTERR